MDATIAPTSTPPAAPLGPGPRAAMVSVPNAPQDLLALPAGATVDGRVVASDAAATAARMVTIETAYGTISIKTTLPLPEGSQLQLQVTGSQNDTATLRLISLDGRTLGRGIQDSLSPHSATPQGSATSPLDSALSTGRPLSSPLSGTTFQATVLQNGALGTGSPSAPFAVSAGSLLTIRLSSGQPLGAGPGTPGMSAPHTAPSGGIGPGSTIPTPPTTPGVTAPTAPSSPLGAHAPAPGAGDTAASPLSLASLKGEAIAAGKAVLSALGGAVKAPVAPNAPTVAGVQSSAAQPAFVPSSSQPSAVPSALPGHTLAATVATQTAGGRTILHTPVGALALNQRLDLPAGSTVSLNVVSYSPPPSAAPPTAALTAPVFGSSASSGSAWPALSESVSVLQNSNPEAARQLLNSIPAPNAALLSNAIAFTQAARTADGSKWPGLRALEALEKSGERGKKLAAQLGQDLSEIAERSKVSSTGQGGEWRTLPMPFMDGTMIAQVTIVTRRPQTAEDLPDAEQERQRQEQGQRFLVGLTLSQLGDLQFDGLYKNKSRQFDLIVRTRDTLPPEVRQALQGLFAQSSQALALSGSLIFRVTDDFPGPVAPAVPGGSAQSADGSTQMSLEAFLR